MSNNINLKKSTPKYIIIKPLKTRHRKNLKSARERDDTILTEYQFQWQQISKQKPWTLEESKTGVSKNQEKNPMPNRTILLQWKGNNDIQRQRNFKIGYKEVLQQKGNEKRENPGTSGRKEE